MKMNLSDGVQNLCAPCPQHMICPIGTESFVPFSHHNFPRIKSRHMAFAGDIFRGYRCQGKDSCPGTISCPVVGDTVPMEHCPGLRSLATSGAVCSSQLRTGVSCDRCEENHFLVMGICVECADFGGFSWEFPGILIFCIPAILLFLCSRRLCKGVSFCGGGGCCLA